MSSSDDEAGDGLGLGAILWGNLGADDELDADYLDKGTIAALASSKVQQAVEGVLQDALTADRAGQSATTSSAAATPAASTVSSSAQDYADEPTLPEDLEDIPELRPQQPAPAVPATAAAYAALAGSAAHVAGEDDYDDDDEMPDAPSAAVPAAAALPHNLTAATAQQQPAMPAGILGVTAAQQQHLASSFLPAVQQQEAPAVGTFCEALAGATEPDATAPPPAAAAPPALTPKQQQELALLRPTPDQEVKQQHLGFYYLDVNDYGEDIVHFSELFAASENALRTACMDAAGKSAEQQHEALTKARDRAERHRQQQNLRIAAAQSQQQAAAAEDGDTAYQGLMPDIADGDESAFAVGDADMLKMASLGVRDHTDELSDAEEELFINRGGLGRALLRAAQYNASTAAPASDTAEQAVDTGSVDAADKAAATASGNGPAAAALLANPFGLKALEAGILPDWEMNIVWGDERHIQQTKAKQRAHTVVELDNNMVASAFQSQQQQQQQVQLPGAEASLPGSSSVMLPGAASTLPGVPSGLPGAASVLSGAASVLTTGTTAAADGTAGSMQTSAVPWGADSAAGAAAAGGGTAAADAGGGQSAAALPGQTSLGTEDAAAAAAAASAAVGKAAGRKPGRHSRSGKSTEATVHLGKPKKDHHVVLASMQAHKHMLRLLTNTEASVIAATAAVDAGDMLAAASAVDRSRAAWGGSAAGGYRGSGRPNEQQQYVDPAAVEQLKLKHVPELLTKELRPVLPDDDEWLTSVIWDKEQAAEQAADQTTGASSRVDGQEGSVLQQGQLVVMQQGGSGASGLLGIRSKVLWDLNDPHMVFEAVNPAQFSTAGAVVQQAPHKAVKHLPPHLLGVQDPLLHELAPLHISCDHLYTTNESKAGRTTGTGKHTQMAVQFSNNLLPLFPKDAFTAFWHRPRHWWSPANLLFQLMRRQEQRDAAGGARKAKGLKFEAVSLTLRKGKAATADDEETDLADVWQVVSNVKSIKDAVAAEMPRLFGPGPDFLLRGWLGEWLDVDRSLKSLGFKPGMNYMVPVWSNVQPLKTTAVGGLLTPDLPSRPPAAFKTLKSLSAHSPGHILLLEYMEERPLMVLQPGMGIRLTTYYRRKNDSDMHYQALQAWYSEGLLARQALPLTNQHRVDTRPPWMVGTPQLLTPDDPSPFFELAPIPPGDMQFAVDTPCFRAPAAPHVGASSDFLLVRSSAGALAVREVTGCVAVGQQHPSMTIWAPMSQEAQAYERARFKAYVIRLLRTRADKPNVKAGKAVASVTLTELMSAFQNMSIALAGRENLARILREECFCAQLPDKPDHWTFVTGAKIPSETDLRKEVTPDQAVQYEALLAGIGQRIVYNLNEVSDVIARSLETTGCPALPTLRLVLDMLLPDEAGKQAAAAIEQCVMNPPWAQSAAYSAALRESRNPTALQLTGRGDPTGRGRGFSYMREETKRPKEETGPQVKAKDDGTITGTDADLRRLGHKRAGELLMTKFNLSADEVNALPRWDRIDMIRRNVRDPKWSSVVTADPELQQFVRNVKMSVEDQKTKMRTTAQPIFAAQMNALLEPWEEEALSDDISWGVMPALRQQTDVLPDTAASGAAAADGSGAAGADGATMGDGAAAAGDAGDTAAAGGDGGGGGSTAAAVSGLAALAPGQELDLGVMYRGPKPAVVRGRQEAMPGERRIRRTIFYGTGNGAVVKRTLLITNRDDIAILNTLHRRGEGFGEQWIPGKQGYKPRFARAVPFGMPWQPVTPEPDPDSLLPPEPTTAAAPPPQPAAAAAAASNQWANSSHGGDLTAAASGGTTAEYSSASAAANAAAYAEQQAAAARAAEELAKAEEWRLRAEQAAAAAAAVATGRPVKAPAAHKGLSKKEAAKAAARAAAAAKKGNKKKRRRYDDFDGSDDSFEMSDSDNSYLEAELEDIVDDDSPTATRTKRPRTAASAAAATAVPTTTTAAAGAAAAGAGGGGDFGGGGVGGGGVMLTDTAPGAMEGASKRLELCLAELKMRFLPVVEGMIRHQASKARMTPQFLRLFEVPVNPKGVTDYAKFVPPEKQMWLLKIKARAQRCFYGSVEEFMSDCQAIVDAAVAYNTIGKGGQWATPAVVDKARSTIDEGKRLLQVQQTENSLDYWCMRVKIERARQRGPEAFRSLLNGALQHSARNGGDAPLGWTWYACESCGQWRLLTDMAGYEMQIWGVEEAKFYCGENVDRPGGPGCQEAPEWVG